MDIRKNYKSFSNGKLIHYYPFDGVYVYFREFKNESTMVIVNCNSDDFEVDLNNYKETLSGTISVKNLKTNDVTDISNNKKINIKKKSAEIFLLIK